MAVLVLALGTWGAGAARRPPPASPEARAEGLEAAERARIEVRLLAAADGTSMERARELVAEGLELRARDPGAAAARFREAADSEALGDWALALAADAHARTGDVETTRAVLAALPPDLASAWGWRAAGTALLEAGEPWAAADSARAGLARARTAADSAHALWAAGKALLRAGDTAAALPLVRGAARGAGRTRAGMEAAAALERLPRREADDEVALVEHAVGRGDLTAAVRGLDRLDVTGAPAASRASAALAVAAALAARGRWDEAERRATAARDGAPAAMLAALDLAVGRARLRQGRVAQAREALDRAAAAGRRSPVAQEALFILADLDEDDGLLSDARDRFARAADLDPASEWGAEAAMRHGLLALRQGDAAGAAQRFRVFRAVHTSGWRYQQATYWAALAHLRAGEDTVALPLLAEVRTQDPVGYYALRAAERSGAGPYDPLAELPPAPLPDEREARLARGALARIEALERLSLPEAAALERLRATDALAGRPGGLHAWAEALHERGRVLDAVRAGRAARRRLGHWDARLLRIVYPLPYGDAIDEAARERELDPALVAALVRQESLFQPDAVSPAGAVGLMQVMPSTARGLAARAGLPLSAAARLSDPDLNLRIGTLHLDDLLRARGGSVDEVLAMYNAGATRVARWRRLAPAGDRDAFLERIPFRETREYLRVVQENAAVYRALYWTGPRAGALAASASDARVE